MELNMAHRGLILAVVLVASCAIAGSVDSPTIGFALPTPDGWRTETIEFPLSFAPELKYEGLEELRFAPGMFTADSEDFWTYVFVWWISDSSSINREELETNLEAYFEGLARAVADERGFDASRGAADVQLSTAMAPSDRAFDFSGTASVFDAFTTGKMLLLNTHVKTVHCPSDEKYAVIFVLSPQPFSHPVWSTLKGIRQEFQCRK